MRNYAVTIPRKGEQRLYIFFDGLDLPKEGTIYSRGERESAQLHPDRVATYYRVLDDSVKLIGHNPNEREKYART